ncbi:MAG: hypothetical protein WAT09_19695 [Paracoccaceae bacterium]
MRILGIILTGLGLAGLFWLTWAEARARAPVYLYGTPDLQAEAAYCLAVAERIREITHEQAEPQLERHIDEQIAFWRTKAGSALGPGRAALGRDTAMPGVNEGAHLHLAVQDCGLRAMGFYRQEFSPLD